jgi:hypothetical protein
MTFAGHCHREQKYGCLSYNHYVILSLEQVDSLVPTITEELGTGGLTIRQSLPPGTTMFLNSSECGPLEHHRLRHPPLRSF